MRALPVALVLALGLAGGPAASAVWTVDPAKSSIGFQAEWLGKPVSGQFKAFSASIDFDPANPAAAKVTATIDLGSATTGDKTVDGALPGDDWFAVKANRQARFVATSIAAAGPGRYVAKGTLALRGAAVPVALPFTLAVAGNVATMTGTLKLDRRAWKIGIGSDAAAEYVAFAVPVTVRVVARRAGPSAREGRPAGR